MHTLQWRLCKERDVGVSLCPLAILAAFEEIVVRRVARKDVIPYEGIVAPPTVIVASDGALRDQIVRGSVPTHSTEGDRVAVVAEGVANDPMYAGATPVPGNGWSRARACSFAGRRTVEAARRPGARTHARRRPCSLWHAPGPILSANET